MPAQAESRATRLLIPDLACVWAKAPKSSDTALQQASLASGLVSLTSMAAVVCWCWVEQARVALASASTQTQLKRNPFRR